MARPSARQVPVTTAVMYSRTPDGVKARRGPRAAPPCPAHAAQPQPQGGRLSPAFQVVNEYVKSRRLGQGSYGKVVLYHSGGQAAPELFAIKVVSRGALSRRHVGGGATALANQLAEIAILRQLEHPNVVRLHEVLNDPGEDKVYIVMEFLGGGPIMAEGDPPLSQAAARAALLQVSAGLGYLHGQGVVHGDLKPDNLLRGGDGVVRITDFGNSAVPPGGVDALVARSPGTPAFTAPECCSGAPYAGRAADVWALGATLFMMLTGQPPFLGSGLLDTYERIVQRQLEVPPALDVAEGGAANGEPGGAAVGGLLRAMLEKAPAQRASLDAVAAHPWCLSSRAAGAGGGAGARVEGGAGGLLPLPEGGGAGDQLPDLAAFGFKALEAEEDDDDDEPVAATGVRLYERRGQVAADRTSSEL